MAYANILLLLCCSAEVFSAYNTAQAFNISHIQGKLPDASIIFRLFNEFLVPVMRSFPQNIHVSNNFKETAVDKAIREKIEELQPFLQDNDAVTDDENLMLEDKDDTTIVEFLPKTKQGQQKIEVDSFKRHLNKYKKIREKINEALTKESVGVKTKSLVIKTLDGLIKSLLSTQCKWKTNPRSVKSEEPSDIAKKWNRSIQDVKNLLISFIEKRSDNTRRSHDVVKFLDAVQIMFRNANDVDTIARNYKILCNFVPKDHNYNVNDEVNTSALRNNWDKTDIEEDRCQNVVVCSTELKEFMKNFFHALNDSAVSVFKNYVEMYTKDVNADNESERDVIISLLNQMTNIIDEGTTKVFVTETQKLALDKKKNNRENIRAMSNYVINTIRSVKKFAEQVLKSELSALRDKILAVIMDDLNVNLDIDLGNLEREFIGKICAMFHLCNGRYRGRRRGLNNLNKNKLYVQAQLTLDDKTDLDSYKIYRKYMNVATQKDITSRGTTRTITNYTVTRTTLLNNFTNTKLFLNKN